MNTKAMQVEQTYDAAWNSNNTHSEGCYALAVDAAQNLGGIELGGIEIYNHNDGNSTWSFAPTRTFKFDDSSTAYITVSGVFAY